MSDNWFMYEGEQYRTQVNLAYNNEKKERRKDNPFLVKIILLPRREKDNAFILRKRFDWVRKAQIKQAQKNGQLFVGERNSSNRKELFFYGSDKDTLQELGESASRLKLQAEWKVYRDPRWALYEKEICPSPAQFQMMENKTLIGLLQKNGDDLTLLRRITHHATFPSELKRINFEQDALKAGFAIGESYYEPEFALAYGATLHKRSTLELYEINRDTNILLPLVQRNGGRYAYWDCPIQRKNKREI